MDNAAKGLLMAGGMLLAVIVISIFIYSYNNITRLSQAQQDTELQKEIEEYNQQYLAFNKSAMYGTDVISILNLAISNNKLNNVQNTPDDQLYVDVSFKLKFDSIQDTVYVYTLNTKTNRYEVSKANTSKNAQYGALDFEFTPGEYSLKNHLEQINEFVKSKANLEEEKSIESTDADGTVLKYTVKYSGVADFKRKTFKCSKVEYDKFGRVKSLNFEQIKGSSYGG
ncbi:MAG: hypothetical protein HFJ19_00055 [Clostridia bacterium]|nr:hypothetical protein [Clostridia bacterium]